MIIYIYIDHDLSGLPRHHLQLILEYPRVMITEDGLWTLERDFPPSVQGANP